MPEHDPFGATDGTNIRPRPGAGRAGWGTAPRRSTAAPFAHVEPIAETTREQLGTGLNPLVRAATPLLLLTGQIRHAVTPMDVAGLRQVALEEIRKFEERTRAAGIPDDLVVPARYSLCAGLDEAVMSTPWGAQSEWAQHSLLVMLHHEAWGGEKFFEMLDRFSQDPARYLPLMELQYLCLAFGFVGKYHVLDRGHERIESIQRELYRAIRDHRGAPPPDLSLRWRGVEDRRNPLIRYVPWWVVGAAALAILAVVFTIYYAKLADAAAPVHERLARVGLETFSQPVAAPIEGPTLKQLLAPDEALNKLRVVEQGGRTEVTLLAPDLFASGSAAVNAKYTETLQHVASAIDQVPGRVLVVGHTDDQQVRSLRYRDNFDLSRERALSVVRILEHGLTNDARVSWSGLGSTKPLQTPASSPENRAHNRRVEIVHVRGR
jgi:type VI secretion system protein ImpK